MKRTKVFAITAFGVTAAALLISAGANAQGKGPGRFGQEQPVFSELDANGDGILTVAEMQARGSEQFDEMDANGDGVLSSDEMVAVVTAKAGEQAKRRFARMLEWRDVDGDGFLSFAEIRDNQAERLFSHVDADRDGVVTEEEFEQAQARGPRFGHGRQGGHATRQGG